jgi:hypothetical protein
VSGGYFEMPSVSSFTRWVMKQSWQQGKNMLVFHDFSLPSKLFKIL